MLAGEEGLIMPINERKNRDGRFGHVLYVYREEGRWCFLHVLPRLRTIADDRSEADGSEAHVGLYAD